MYKEWTDPVEVGSFKNGIANVAFSKKELPVEFFSEVVQKVKQFADDGKIEFEEKEFIKIFVDSESSMVYEVTDFHRKKYPQEYAFFRRGDEQLPEGHMPLSSAPFLTKLQVEQFKVLYGIRSLEQLAVSTSQKLSGIMHADLLIQQAQTILKTREDGAFANKLENQNKILTNEIEALKAEMRKLTSASQEKKEK